MSTHTPIPDPAADRYLAAVTESLDALAAGDVIAGQAAVAPTAGELWEVE